MPQLVKAYEAFQRGKHQTQQVFDLTAPEAPHGGNYLVFAGLEQTLSDVHNRRFTPEHIARWRALDYFSEEFLQYLQNFTFEGDIDALQEGRIVSPGIPLMRIRASEVELALLEDIIKNRISFATNIATKTARIVQAANGDFVTEEAVGLLQKLYRFTRDQIKKARGVLEFGQRRAEGKAATLAALAAVIGGAVATSNVKAAKQHFLELSGTMMHFLVQLFGPEREADAFRAYAEIFPDSSVFLIDTFDTLRGAQNAIIVAKEMEAAGHKLVGVRLDSGDLVVLSQQVRKMLDEAGLHYVKIVASDDLDEAKITDLISKGAQIDVFGVGTNLVTGGKQASLKLDFVKSDEKRYWRARYREEIEELLMPYWRKGQRTFGVEKPWKAHERAVAEMNQLSPKHKQLDNTEPIPVEDRHNPLSINPETDAVLVIDAQKAFMARGGLPVNQGDQIMPNVRKILDLFPKEKRFASIDRHPKGHFSFASSFNHIPPFTYLTYDMVKDWAEDEHHLADHALFTLAELKEELQKIPGQMLWTDHAVEGSKEDRLHPGMLEKEFEYTVIKGMDPKTDSYSAFFDNAGRPTGLAEELKKRGIKRLFVVGLAGDYCVGWSAEGGVKEGFEVAFIEDATRNVGFPPDSVSKMKASFAEKGIQVVEKTKDFVAANQNVGVFPATRLKTPIAHPAFPEEDENTGLEEDMYHLTVAQLFFSKKIHEKQSVANYFFRKPPYGEDKIVVSGVKFFLEELKKFRFTDDDIEYLRSQNKFSEEFLEYLRDFQFKGDIDGLPDGSVAFANEPILTVRGSALEILIIETLILKKVNFNSLIATWANHKRQKHGENVRLISDQLAGAQGIAHSEAVYSAFVGGISATTDIDAHLNHNVPLAWPGEEGVWLGADLITGGPQAALGGVYKLVRFDGEDRLKVSGTKGKTTFPGDQASWAVIDESNRVVRRVIAHEDEQLDLKPNETAIYLKQPLVRQGNDVYGIESTRRIQLPPAKLAEVQGPGTVQDEGTPKIPDAWETRAYRDQQVRDYADVHGAEVSPGLKARQEELIARAIGGSAAELRSEVREVPIPYQQAYQEVIDRLEIHPGVLLPHDRDWETTRNWLTAKKRLIEEDMEKIRKRKVGDDEARTRLRAIETFIPYEIALMEVEGRLDEHKIQHQLNADEFAWIRVKRRLLNEFRGVVLWLLFKQPFSPVLVANVLELLEWQVRALAEKQFLQQRTLPEEQAFVMGHMKETVKDLLSQSDEFKDIIFLTDQNRFKEALFVLREILKATPRESDIYPKLFVADSYLGNLSKMMIPQATKDSWKAERKALRKLWKSFSARSEARNIEDNLKRLSIGSARVSSQSRRGPSDAAARAAEGSTLELPQGSSKRAEVRGKDSSEFKVPSLKLNGKSKLQTLNSKLETAAEGGRAEVRAESDPQIERLNVLVAEIRKSSSWLNVGGAGTSRLLDEKCAVAQVGSHFAEWGNVIRGLDSAETFILDNAPLGDMNAERIMSQILEAKNIVRSLMQGTAPSFPLKKGAVPSSSPKPAANADNPIAEATKLIEDAHVMSEQLDMIIGYREHLANLFENPPFQLEEGRLEMAHDSFASIIGFLDWWGGQEFPSQSDDILKIISVLEKAKTAIEEAQKGSGRDR